MYFVVHLISLLPPKSFLLPSLLLGSQLSHLPKLHYPSDILVSQFLDLLNNKLLSYSQPKCFFIRNSITFIVSILNILSFDRSQLTQGLLVPPPSLPQVFKLIMTFTSVISTLLPSSQFFYVSTLLSMHLLVYPYSGYQVHSCPFATIYFCHTCLQNFQLSPSMQPNIMRKSGKQYTLLISLVKKLSYF